MKLLITRKTNLLWYGVWSHLKGLDLSRVSLEKLGLDADRSTNHLNSGGPDLAHVLKEIEIPFGSRALDLGSGKGGAILTLSEFPFAEIVGVELSADLIRIAEANVRRLGLRHVHFVHADAADFMDMDRFTHIYMYYPFHCTVMNSVMVNLVTSLARKERDLILIYKNPICHDTVMSSGLFRMEPKFNFDENSYSSSQFCVYVHKVNGF
jgi:SAM-dependent methyltransferase